MKIVSSLETGICLLFMTGIDFLFYDKNLLNKSEERNIETGDILIFSGKGNNSKYVKLFQWSQVTHVAMAWICPITKDVYCWEIGNISCNSYGVISKQGAIPSFSRLYNLRLKLQNSKYTKVWIRKLRNHSIDHKELTNFIIKNLGLHYNYNVVYPWMERVQFPNWSIISFYEHFKPLDKKFTCSELIRYTLEHFGFKCKAFKHEGFYPKDFLFQDISNLNGFYDSVKLLWSK